MSLVQLVRYATKILAPRVTIVAALGLGVAACGGSDGSNPDGSPGDGPTGDVVGGRVPGAPTGVVATASIDLAALVSFTAPGDPGSSPITGYSITSDPGGIVVALSDPAVTQGVVAGLTLDQSTTFTVHATNAVGDGPESDPSNTVTIVAGPDAPVLGGCGQDGEATLSWPAVAGAASYNLYFSATAGVSKLTGTQIADVTSPYTHTPLADGTYHYVLEAVAAGGVVSQDSAELSVEVGPGVHDTFFAVSYSVGGVEIFDCMSQIATGTSGGSRFLVGAATGLGASWYGGVAVDKAANTLYVSDSGNSAIRVWENAATADGDDAPDRVLTGVATKLAVQGAIALDTVNDRLYVIENESGTTVLIFADASSLDGDVAPVCTLTSSSFNSLQQISFDEATDTLYLTNLDAVLAFENASALAGDVLQDADRAFALADTRGISRDPATDLLYVGARLTAGGVYVVENGSTADGTVVPVRTLMGDGVAPQIDSVEQVQVVDDQLFVFNDGSDRVFVYDHASTADGTQAADREILLTLDHGAGLLYVK